MRSVLLLVVAMAAALSGCAQNRLVGRDDLTILPGAELPAPGNADLIAAQRPYVIGPFDRVSIDVYGVPELSRTVQVDASGTVSLPLTGAVEASGLTPIQLEDAIEGRLRGRYVRDPQVTVNTETVNQMITVEGQVKRPGLYPVTSRMTLLRAVARAEGMTEFASQNFVVVFRRVNGQQMAALYDMRAIRQGAYPDPEVYANDVVLVGESGGRRAFQAAIQGAAILLGPLVVLLQ